MSTTLSAGHTPPELEARRFRQAAAGPYLRGIPTGMMRRRSKPQLDREVRWTKRVPDPPALHGVLPGAVTTTETPDVSALPLAPKNPLPFREVLKAVRNLDKGQELIREAGGPITRVQLGPK